MRTRRLRKIVKDMRHGISVSILPSATRHPSGARVTWITRVVAWITFLATPYCIASNLSIEIVDRIGHGVDQVAVEVMPTSGAPVPAPKRAVMDQKDRAFVPQVLIVGVGSSVEFPNNDSVSHQVYSFSPAKRFQLPLYKGQVHPPVTFDEPGLVVLGCNIHDSMVGYIYVTAAPIFGTTDARGTVVLRNIPKGNYRITISSPYIADNAASLTRDVGIDGDSAAAERFELTAAVRTRPEPRPGRRDWDY
jgi:plastocyanin